MRPVRMGLRDLGSHWPKYLATATGMLLGVLGVVAIAVVGSVASEMLVAQQEQLNGREASFANEMKTTPSDFDVTAGSTPIAEFYKDVQCRIGPQNASAVLESATTMILRTIDARNDNRAGIGLAVYWVLGDINDVQRLPVLSGSMPHESTYPPQFAINVAGARALGIENSGEFYVSATPSGASTLFSVAAIVADGQQVPRAYGSLTAAMELFPETLANEPLSVRVRASSGDLSSVDELIANAAADHKLVLGTKTSRTDTVETVRDQVGFFTVVFGICAGLVLLISAMATTAVGIASVRERSRELVVRRAVGAQRRDIFLQVMSASLGVGTIVAIVAVAAAVIGVFWVVPAQIPAATSIVAPAFPWVACAIGVGSSYLTSGLGAILPAITATRLQVALALRE